MEIKFEVREDKMWLKPLTLNNGMVLEVKTKGIGEPNGYRIFLLANDKLIEEASTGDQSFVKNFGHNQTGTREGVFDQINKWANYLYEKYNL